MILCSKWVHGREKWLLATCYYLLRRPALRAFIVGVAGEQFSEAGQAGREAGQPLSPPQPNKQPH